MKNLIPIIITFSIFSIIILVTVGFQSCQDEISGTELKPLTVGDQMPAISATISINVVDNRETLKTSSDKLIILEFIDTHCSVSRETIPHLQRLQQTFKDDLTIILITKQTDSLVRSLSSNLGWSLPIITEDTTLSQLFPYLTVPHQVWIKNRRIEAITNWEYANEVNISKLLAGNSVKTTFKNDDFIDFSKSLTQNGISPYYQSEITPPINYGSGTRIEQRQFTLFNADIRELYRYAFNRPSSPHYAYVITEASDSLSRLIKGPEGQITGHYQLDSMLLLWRDRYTFCYGYTCSEGDEIQQSILRTKMTQDINYFFADYLGIKGTLEKRKVKCLTLVNTDNQARYRSGGDSPSLTNNSSHYKIINKPIKLLIRQIAYQHDELGIPIINATGFTGNIDLEIKGGLEDLKTVNLGLAGYGLQFVEQDHEIEVVVLKEIPPTN